MIVASDVPISTSATEQTQRDLAAVRELPARLREFEQYLDEVHEAAERLTAADIVLGEQIVSHLQNLIYDAAIAHTIKDLEVHVAGFDGLHGDRQAYAFWAVWHNALQLDPPVPYELTAREEPLYYAFRRRLETAELKLAAEFEAAAVRATRGRRGAAGELAILWRGKIEPAIARLAGQRQP